jgi:puromycin-sensitive aminopeptidase
VSDQSIQNLNPEVSFRLPRSVVPLRYELTLRPDLTAFTFQGQAAISVEIVESVSRVMLNAVELEIESAALSDERGQRRGGTIELDPDSERASIVLDSPAEPGHWTLELTFRGILNDKLAGFYRSTYRDAAGQEQVIATTQFESTDARRAFPCWDEPEYKATFKVTLVVDEDLMAISNARVESESALGNGKKAVSFAETMKMSTYLVAFIVGRFEATEPRLVDGKPLRVICVPGKLHLTPFAVEAGAFSLEFFARYYGIPYPGDKMDMIAIPDFAAGAMENLGAVTYRETALLVDREHAARAELERVADVVAHELAHMWFGDLVTMKWWNGIWLNEAFATFMEMLAVDAWKPAWERWVSFGISRAAAMQTDGLRSTRPIEYPVRAPDEAAGMFDILTYEKGAAVLRMLEQYLGAEVFQRGIGDYLRSHAYGNTETTDLWDSIEESSGEPARKIMDSWIFQAGFPLVSVERQPDGRLKLSQRMFRYLQDEQPGDVRWQVPLMLRSGTGEAAERRKLLLTEAEQIVEAPAGADWVVANEGGHGFFRVRYSSDLLRGLTANLQEGLSAIERFNLVSDTWASVLAGLSPLSDFLNLARLLSDETDRNVWAAVFGGLGYLNRAMDSSSRPALQAFVRDLVRPALARLGWEPTPGESELVGQLRGSLVGTLGTLGRDPEVIRRARELFANYTSDRGSVDRNLVPSVVSVYAYNGAQAEYDDLVERYRTASTPQEEQRFLFSLASFQHRDLVQRTAEMTLTDQVRTQNAPYLVASLMHNLVGGDLAWAFTKANWDTLLSRFPENSIVRMCEGITALATPKQEADVRAFFAEHTVPAAGKTLDQHLERLHIAVVFKQREDVNLRQAFPPESRGTAETDVAAGTLDLKDRRE